MKFRILSHNGVSRQSFVKREERDYTAVGCKNCGTFKKLFSYGILRDDSQVPDWISGKFCCVSCFREYHGINGTE